MSAVPPPPGPGKKSCAFCLKPQSELKNAIEGPGGACICFACVEVCHQIVADARKPRTSE